MTTHAPIKILLVEDDLADQKLIKNSLQNQSMLNELYVAGSGEEALDLLHHRGDHVNGTPQPDLILLDLNMPGMGGKEFLRQIKGDEGLKQVPVVILTTSNSERDILDSYKLQAAGYVHKPSTQEHLKEVMQEIEQYWFVLCKLPTKEC